MSDRLDDWEDVVPPAVLARANEGGDDDAAMLSEMYALAKLQGSGYTVQEAAAALGITTNRANKAVRDPRYELVARRFLADPTGGIVLDKAKASFRLEAAWEVLTAELKSSDKWLRHQAAMAIIAASKADSQAGKRVEIIMHPSMLDDDEDEMQDSAPDGAEIIDLQPYDA